jgi:hypothetical protein
MTHAIGFAAGTEQKHLSLFLGAAAASNRSVDKHGGSGHRLGQVHGCALAAAEEEYVFVGDGGGDDAPALR